MQEILFWRRWLLIVGIMIATFGLLMALLSGTPLFDLFNRHIDPAFWSANAIGEGTKMFRQWVYGVWGAAVAGWGIFLAFIAFYQFREKEKWAWNCVAAGLSAWFILDTALSVSYQVYFNVCLNPVVLILTMLPLLFARRYFLQ